MAPQWSIDFCDPDFKKNNMKKLTYNELKTLNRMKKYEGELFTVYGYSRHIQTEDINEALSAYLSDGFFALTVLIAEPTDDSIYDILLAYKKGLLFPADIYHQFYISNIFRSLYRNLVNSQNEDVMELEVMDLLQMTDIVTYYSEFYHYFPELIDDYRDDIQYHIGYLFDNLHNLSKDKIEKECSNICEFSLDIVERYAGGDLFECEGLIELRHFVN